jgi:ferrous iron transport protein B
MSSCCESTVNSCAQTNQQLAAHTIALIGNPNCGKTTLFNALTGAKQRIGNWPGVTVEQKSGVCTQNNVNINVIDLPGVYSLIQAAENTALDEHITTNFILSEKADLILNIIDANHLERHLYLTLQLREMGIPVIVVLNMMDILRTSGTQIDIKQLSNELGCPVIGIEARSSQGIDDLKKLILNTVNTVNTLNKKNQFSPKYHDIPEIIQKNFLNIAKNKNIHPWLALHTIEGNLAVHAFLSEQIIQDIKEQQTIFAANLTEDIDILLANARYCYIQKIIPAVFKKITQKTNTTWTERIDSIILNRILGIPVFLGMMYLVFFFSINIGGAFQDFFDITSETIFVNGLTQLLSQWHAPNWLIVLLANGMGKGINTTLTFIPVIGSMFLFLTLLEDSGYMARAAFVIDRFMRFLGLPGKAFVPMIIGFGCNVPAVMGARTLEYQRDRLLTIMMAPFMSCSARLAIFAVFTAAFFPKNGENVIFFLYIIGIMMAMLTGFILRRTVLPGELSPLIMELPRYHVPHFKSLMIHAWHKLSSFVLRAGKLIVPICILIGALNSLNTNGIINTGEGDSQSILSMIGRFASPIFSPMGITPDNWPATVGLVTGILAKEVVIGTLNTLYTQVGMLNVLNSNETFHFWGSIAEAFQSIPQNLSELSQALSNPIWAKASVDPVNQGVYGIMYQQFDGQAGAFAYLLFILLYFPCVSTLGAMLREAHKGWSLFSTCWMTYIAYATAVFFYQAATLFKHPNSSILWMTGIMLSLFCIISGIRWVGDKKI